MSPEDIEAIKQLRRSAVNKDLLEKMKNLLMLGAGAGAAGTGLYQLGKQVAEDSQTIDPPYLSAEPIHLRQRAKSAFASLNEATSGTGARGVEDLWYAYPALAGSAAAGIGAGVAGTSLLIKKLRERALDQELEEAKMEFESALRGEPSRKQASDEDARSLRVSIDRLYAAASRLGLDKRGADSAQLMGRGLGLYALFAALSGGLGAASGYNHARKDRKSEFIEAASRERMARRLKEDPPRPVAVLDPIEEEEDEESSHADTLI